jgi:uncharacterized protein
MAGGDLQRKQLTASHDAFGGRMTEKIKASRYNHFVPLENGNRLAFNALTCGLAEMDPASYQRYCDLIAHGEINGDGQDDLIVNLRKGGFITLTDVDELNAIRAVHYQARFGSQGLGLTVIPTSTCNFACDYCYESHSLRTQKAEQGGVMSDEVRANVVRLCEERIEQRSGLNVMWYGGEPLLARPIIEQLTAAFRKVCREKEAHYGAGMITNGYLLGVEAREFLCEMGVKFVQVTLDGPRNVHDRRRCLKSGNGTFDRIVKNLDSIGEDAGIGVALRVNIDQRNAREIPELLAFLRDLGWNRRKHISIHFGQVMAYTASCQDIGSHCMVTPVFSEFVIEAYRIALEMGFRHTDFPSRHASPCSAVGRNSWVIEPTGTVQNCWNTIGDANRKTGTLTDRGIIPTENYIKWLGWSPFTARSVSSCETCDILPACMGGCPYRSIYPEATAAIEQSVCVPHRYNLHELLKQAAIARTRGLLDVRGQTAS